MSCFFTVSGGFNRRMSSAPRAFVPPRILGFAQRTSARPLCPTCKWADEEKPAFQTTDMGSVRFVCATTLNAISSGLDLTSRLDSRRDLSLCNLVRAYRTYNCFVNPLKEDHHVQN